MKTIDLIISGSPMQFAITANSIWRDPEIGAILVINFFYKPALKYRIRVFGKNKSWCDGTIHVLPGDRSRIALWVDDKDWPNIEEFWNRFYNELDRLGFIPPAEQTTQKMTKKRQERIAKIVMLRAEDPAITTDQLASKLGVDERTIGRDLKWIRENESLPRDN